jgi:hypothetical protein
VKCFANCGQHAIRSNTLCAECSRKNRKNEIESSRHFRENWIAELELKRTLCLDKGWYPWTPKECRDWFTVEMGWPEYTPKKEYENKIRRLQIELGIEPTVEHHANLCPCPTEGQGKSINAKFEELTGA